MPIGISPRLLFASLGIGLKIGDWFGFGAPDAADKPCYDRAGMGDMAKTITFHPQLVELLGKPSTTTIGNLRTLAQLFDEIKPARTLEIGLGAGASALLFASHHQAAGHGAQVHVAIDPYQLSPTAFNSAGLRALERAGLDRFVSYRNGLSSLELPKLIDEGASFDLIYIDGSHLFEDVFVDAYFSLRLLNSEGVMAFDDSSAAQVLKVIRFVRANMKSCLAELDLSPYRNDPPFFYPTAKALGRLQLTAFRRVGPTERDWQEWERPLRRF